MIYSNIKIIYVWPKGTPTLGMMRNELTSVVNICEVFLKTVYYCPWNGRHRQTSILNILLEFWLNNLSFNQNSNGTNLWFFSLNFGWFCAKLVHYIIDIQVILYLKDLLVLNIIKNLKKNPEA